MPDNQALEKLQALQAEAEAKATRIAQAVRIGVLIPEIRALPDGGRSLFDKETWDKIQNPSENLRPANVVSSRKVSFR